MDCQIVKSSIVAVSKDQVSCDLAGEAVILNTKDGTYYSLNPLGALIWNLMQTPVTVNAILDELLKEYDVSREQCENDLLSLLSEFESRGLVEIKVNGIGPSR